MIKLTRVQFDFEIVNGQTIHKFADERDIWVMFSAIRSMEVRKHGDLIATCLYLGANQFPVVKETPEQICRLVQLPELPWLPNHA